MNEEVKLCARLAGIVSLIPGIMVGLLTAQLFIPYSDASWNAHSSAIYTFVGGGVLATGLVMFWVVWTVRRGKRPARATSGSAAALAGGGLVGFAGGLVGALEAMVLMLFALTTLIIWAVAPAVLFAVLLF